MTCTMEKVGIAGSLTGLAGAGVVAVVGAPTVVVSAAGVAAAVGALVASIDALDRLRQCLANAGKVRAAENLQATVDELRRQLEEIQQRLPLPD